ncbi:MAG: MFS transporter [Defluviitaleaceae bacterium]|nr:MFS transporter [Defluviitaleaceae bacterium]
MRTRFKEFLHGIKQMRGTNVWVFIMYGLLFDMVNNLWRPFSARFLERLGGGEFEIALLTSLPGAVAALVLLPGAIIFRKFTNKKRATAAFILISRAVLLFIAFVPFLPPAVQPLMFLVLVAIMNCPDALSQTSLQSLLGTVFNGSKRGQAIALRTKFGQAVVPVVTISAGLAITFIPNDEYQRMVLYQIFFIIAFLLGIVEVYVFNKLQVPTEQTPATDTPATNRVNLKTIFCDRKFLRFFIPALFFLFTWQAGWPLVNILIIIEKDASEMWLAIIALVLGATAFFSGTFWQKLLHKRGNTVIFVAAIGLLGLNMFIFPIVPNMMVMAAIHVITGFSAVGINTALLNGVLEATPNENRLMYLAFFNTVQNISLFITPFFAFWLFTVTGLTVALFIIGGLRFIAMGFVWFMLREAKNGEI